MQILIFLKMKKNLFITGIFLLLSSVTVLFAQKPIQPAPKKSLIGDYLSIGGYINSQYSFESQKLNDGTLDESNTFQIRRARLDIKGNITKNIEFRLQGDFTKSAALVDAFVKVKFNPYINVQVGQFKIPFSIENPYAPLDLEAIDNAQVINALSGFSDVSGNGNYKFGREIGVMLYGGFINMETFGKKFQLFNYSVGVFNGAGINTKDNNKTKDIAGRLELHPWIKELVLAGSMYIGEYQTTNNENAVRNRYGIGGEYKNNHLVVRSEYLWGVTGMDNTDEFTLAEGKLVNDQKSDGFYAIAAYVFNVGKEGKQTIAPVVRYDYYNSNTDLTKTTSTYYMLGLDWWPEKHLRFQLNYTLKDNGNNDNLGHAVAAMLSVKF